MGGEAPSLAKALWIRPHLLENVLVKVENSTLVKREWQKPLPLEYRVASLLAVDGFDAEVFRALAKFFFDAQELVVLGDAVGTGDGAGLDLSGAGAHGKVGDEGVFGFAGAVGDDRRVTVAARNLDSFERLGDRTDLIHLDEYGVAYTLLDALAEAAGIGDEEVVADELAAVADLVGEDLPTVPVVFGKAVFNRDDGILANPVGPESRHLRGGLLALVGLLEDVFAGFLVEEFAAGGVEREYDVLTRFVACECDGFEDDVDGFDVGLERRGKAAFIANGGVVALLLEHALEGVEDFGTPAQGFGEAFGADGHDHELLEVHVVIGVCATVDDVHHRRGQQAGIDAAEIAIERQLERVGRGARGGHGDSKDGVSAKVALVGRAIDLEHGGVDEALICRVDTGELGRDGAFDVLHGLHDALAEIDFLVAVAKLYGFVFAGAGAGRNGCAANGSAGEDDVGFNGWIATAVENFARLDCDDFSHVAFPFGHLRREDAVLQSVVQPWTTVYGNCAAAYSDDRFQQFRHTFR